MAGNALVAQTTIHPDRLFIASCMSLVSTSVAFSAITSVMTDFKEVFSLTGIQAGVIGGVTLWGFTITIFIFGPLVDAIGMRPLLRFAMLGHFAGPLLMIFAKQLGGFNALFAGGFLIALANGTVEAVCNPLIATIYPEKKTIKLNQFHVWFPGGIAIGGLLAFGIDQCKPSFWEVLSITAWQVKLGLILIPTIIYGILFTGQKFPATERVQSGLSFGDMVQATLFRPLFLVLFVCMGLTASLELGPNRWMSDVMDNVIQQIFHGGKAGILILVYGSVLMAVLRYFAGPVVHHLSNTGILLLSAILAGVGLFLLAYANNAYNILIAATLFYLGVCYFWPTMLGTVAERVPRGGAMALSILGGWGTAIVGLVTTPAMGYIGDYYGRDQLPREQTVQIIQQGMESLPPLRTAMMPGDAKIFDKEAATVGKVHDVIQSGAVFPTSIVQALRIIAKYNANTDLGKKAAELSKEADYYGGPFSFRWVSSLSIVLVVIFGILFLRDRMHGGYEAEHIAPVKT